jgi:hypothetical protein
MVYYNSQSSLPSSTSILCFSSSLFNFYALFFFLLCSTMPPVQFLFCLLCYVLPLHALHYPTYLPFRLCTASHPADIFHTLRDTLSLLYSECLSHVDSSARSSSKIFIFSGHYSRFFGFFGSYPESRFLLFQSKFFVFSGSYSQSIFWHLWLLSPFLHVTSGSDHTPIQKVLHILGLVSTSSLFSDIILGD